MNKNYYEKELDLIDFRGEHSAHVLFGSDGAITKAMAVNHESARAIINKLVEVFCTGEPLPPPPKPDAVPALPVLNFVSGRDRNGNKIVRVFAPGERGFGIQTNGNLPNTHRDGITAATADEVRAYVRRRGTRRQRAVVGV